MKILIDAMSGDNAPLEMIKGAYLAKQEYKHEILLIGDENIISDIAVKEEIDLTGIRIIHSTEVITMEDRPLCVVREKKQSSMSVGLRLLAGGEVDAFVSAGNTGVLLTGAMRYVSAERRVRPSLAAVLPSADGGFTCLVDTGATIDCTPDMLHHFARLGSDFMKNTYAIESPRVGLLSNGHESSKGNKLVKETYPLLAADESLSFVGNVEGNTALSGICDVLVCDGFAGNQVLKVTEGTATRIITDVMKYAHKTGSDEIKKLAAHLMKIYDISSLGGGVILGIGKPVIKARGNANESSVVNISEMLLNMAHNKAVFDKERNKL